MRNKIKYVMVFMGLLLMTGCVKYDATMDIKKDKSMDFIITYALDSSIFGDESILKDEDITKLKEEGFTIKDYSDNNMKGYTLSKSISNIDSVSTSNSNEYDLTGMLGSDNNNYIFKVDKGIFKNKYTAIMKFDSKEEESNLPSDDQDLIDVTSEEDNVVEDDTVTTDEDSDIALFDDSTNTDFSSLYDSISLTFNVKLPYSAISNNATKTEEYNRVLTWNLKYNDTESIEFVFELYNFTNVYIGLGVLLVLLILIIVLASITTKKRKNLAPIKKKEEEVKKEVSPSDFITPVNTVVEANSQNNDLSNGVSI